MSCLQALASRRSCGSIGDVLCPLQTHREMPQSFSLIYISKASGYGFPAAVDADECLGYDVQLIVRVYPPWNRKTHELSPRKTVTARIRVLIIHKRAYFNASHAGFKVQFNSEHLSGILALRDPVLLQVTVNTIMGTFCS